MIFPSVHPSVELCTCNVSSRLIAANAFAKNGMEAPSNDCFIPPSEAAKGWNATCMFHENVPPRSTD